MTENILQRAEILVNQGKYEDAERLLKDLLINDPNDVHVLTLLSEVKLQQGKVEEADRLINVAIGISPDFGFLFYVKARISIHLSQYDEAERNIKQAVEMEPFNANFFALWGSIKLTRKQYDLALELADKSLALDAENLLGLNVRSTALMKLNNKEESFRTIEGALREDPNNSYTHSNYGWNLLEKGEHKKALEHFKEALKNDPNNGYAKAGMAEALKASNFLYKGFLKYSFFMSNLTAKYQWGVIIGFYLLSKGLRTVAQQYEALSPYLMPLIILLALFAFSTWVIGPLSNLFLRLNKYGKYLLDKKEILSSNFVGVSFLVFLVGIAAYLVMSDLRYLTIAAFGFTMMVPLSSIFSPTKYKHSLVIFSGVLGLLGIGAILVTFYTGEIFNTLTTGYFLGFMGYQWGANFLMIRQSNV
jgi:tetratricopeptide (TPR) repeat protein